MDKLIMVIQLLAGLSLLVIVHEFGHFIAARAFGMRVEKFYLFFDAYGKKLFSFKKGDTEYGVGWLPLGGYVKISGMIDESMDKEQIAEEPKPWEFRSKPAWQRLIVMLGGIILNVVLGYIIFTGKIGYFGEKKVFTEFVNEHGGIYVPEFAKESGFETGDQIVLIKGKEVPYFNDIMFKHLLFSEDNTATVIRDGVERDIQLSNNFLSMATNGAKQPIIQSRFEFAIDSVIKDMPAAKAGLMKGDRILSINYKSFTYYDEFSKEIDPNKSKEIALRVLRGADTLDMKMTVTEEGTIGFYPIEINDEGSDTTLRYGFSAALKQGYVASKEALIQQSIGLKSLIVGKLNFMKSVSSPIGIAKIYGGKFSWKRFWDITGLLSFVLAIMNLLPIPALDGGHVIFLLVEMVRGKPFSDKVMMRAQVIGFVIIMGIMLLAVFSDLFFK